MLPNRKVDLQIPFFVMVALILVTGCTTTTTVRSWHPGEVADVGGQRLAVLAVRGDSTYRGLAQQQFVDQLKGCEANDVLEISAESVRRHSGLYESLTQRSQFIESVRNAHNQGADVMLVSHLEVGYNGLEVLGIQNITIGDPTIDVSFEFELVDLRSNQKLAQDEIIRTFQGEFDENSLQDNSEKHIVEDLVQQCVQAAVAKVSSHQESTNVRFALDNYGIGSSEVRTGNRLAVTGDWGSAVESWQLALQEDPENKAALFNLGLVHEINQNPNAAEIYYREAKRLGSDDRSDEALSRIADSRQVMTLSTAARNRRHLHSRFAGGEWLTPTRLPTVR